MMPSTVELFGQTFAVQVCELPENLAGDSDPSRRLIRINKDMTAETQAETFYHEVAHVIMDLTGYNGMLDDKLEEALAQAIGLGILNLLSNPELP
jgi:hypothetical protein